MKHILLLTISIGLFGCNTQHPAAKKLSEDKRDTVKIQDSIEEASDYRGIEADTVIPAGIGIDSLRYTDSSLYLVVDIRYAYPTDESMAAYRQLLTKAIDTVFTAFKQSVTRTTHEDPPDPETAYESLQHNEFSVFPVNFYQDNYIVSIRFGFSTFTAGAVHPVSYLVSINYDKQARKVISVNDYFNIKNSGDSSLMISLLDKEFVSLRRNMQNDDPWAFYGVSRIDFNVSKDFVTFNFGDYVLGQGPTMLEYKVSKPELISLINPSYR